MKPRTPLGLVIVIMSIGFLLPIVPRLVVPVLRPYPYDDPFVGAGILRIGPLLLWNMVPFALLAAVAYVWLSRPSLSPYQRTIVRGGIVGALLTGIVVGVWVHTPDPAAVGANIGAGLFPLYMAILMPAGFGLGALVA